MKQEFSTERLKDFLERGFGWELRTLERLPGHAYSLNFKGVRDVDGFPFLVKLTPKTEDPRFKARYENLTANLPCLRGTKAVVELFAKGPHEFRGFHLRYLSWCEGRRLFPDRLTERQFLGFLDDYLQLSVGMQKVTSLLPTEDRYRLCIDCLAERKGPVARMIRRRIAQEMPLADVTYDPARLRVIHGDFHHGNFLFKDGVVTGFFDLEELRKGYPAEDIVRYFTCAIDHLRWYEQCRRKCIMDRFVLAVRHLSYTEHEWNVAINRSFLPKIVRGVRRGCGLMTLLNLAWRVRNIRRMRLIVAAHGVKREEVGE